jgi:uncharacterized protein
MRSFHSGELAVQARAGVTFVQDRPVFADTLTAKARVFLESQSFLIVASKDDQDRPWASILTGAVGFASAPDDQTIAIAALPTAGDPLEQGLLSDAAIGLLVIDPATRRRHRINGRVQARTTMQDGLRIKIEQAYGNCPQYIQARRLEPVRSSQPNAAIVQQSSELTTAQRDWIMKADTFFIASSDPEGGADASHRGGQAGFVRVIDSRHLEFPDYAGNKMFNTLGNILNTERMGLLFLDFQDGRTLQLTGRAEVIWDASKIAQYPGAERVIRFELELGIQTIAATGLRWSFIEAWAGNPDLELVKTQNHLAQQGLPPQGLQ